MKTALLIGDSIRMGYDKYVREVLKDKVEIYSPSENCRFAQYVLRYLEMWHFGMKIPEDIDVIHWNAGLWDTLRNYDDDCLTPPEVYESFIDRICKKLRRFYPHAKIIFATSTPVVEERFSKESYRLNKDVRQYNEIAVRVCKSYGFEINDLYSVIEGVPVSYYSDCTHLHTEEGESLLTEAVVKAIAKQIDLNVDDLDFKICFKEKKDVTGI